MALRGKFKSNKRRLENAINKLDPSLKRSYDNTLIFKSTDMVIDMKIIDIDDTHIHT